MITIEHNIATGEAIDRDMTKDELSQYKLDEVAAAAKSSAKEAKEIAKAALLERLGITADEAALLLQ